MTGAPTPAPELPVPPRAALAARVAGPLVAPVAGLLVVEVVVAFRWPWPWMRDRVALAVAVGVVALVLALTRRRPAAVLLAGACGLLLLTKPFLVPMGFRFSSETGMTYTVPGASLVALAVAVARTLTRPALVEERRPGLLSSALFVAGLAAAGAWYSQPTFDDVLARRRADLLPRRRALETLAARLVKGGFADVPRERLDLSPPARLVVGEPRGDTVAVLSFDQLARPDALHVQDDDRLHLHGPYLEVMQLLGPEPYGDRGARLREPSRDPAGPAELITLSRVEDVRWLAVIRRGGGAAERWAQEPFELFLGDALTGELLLRRVVKPTPYGSSDTYAAVLAQLAEATGGDVRDRP